MGILKRCYIKKQNPNRVDTVWFSFRIIDHSSLNEQEARIKNYIHSHFCQRLIWANCLSKDCRQSNYPPMYVYNTAYPHSNGLNQKNILLKSCCSKFIFIDTKLLCLERGTWAQAKASFDIEFALGGGRSLHGTRCLLRPTLSQK